MITPTDVDGWIHLMPAALIIGLVLLGLTALMEQTDRGRRFADRVIRWLTR